jgi:hypothetical protein
MSEAARERQCDERAEPRHEQADREVADIDPDV